MIKTKDDIKIKTKDNLFMLAIVLIASSERHLL